MGSFPVRAIVFPTPLRLSPCPTRGRASPPWVVPLEGKEHDIALDPAVCAALATL
jgi:hypothetical protein